MRNFEFSLWIFDDGFIVSALIVIFSCFGLATILSTIFTSQPVRDFFTGNTKSARKKTRQEILRTMREHLESVYQGRRTVELESWERKHLKELREYYYNQLKEINK